MAGESFISDITSNTTHVTKDNQTQLKENVVVHISDYGDDYFDLALVDTTTNSLFGKTSLCGVPGWNKIETVAEKIAALHGLKVTVSKEDPDPNF